jgi:glycosyltransferase involved in cell wall biosynthesis
MSRKLTIILRTCGRVQAQHGTRYIDKPKSEIIKVCVSSLVHSVNQVKDHQIELICLDDHSDEACVHDIKEILSECLHKIEFISLDVTGNGPSMGEVYKLVESRATDLWYHVEDDYLHKPEAIQDMIDSVDQFEGNTGQMVAVNPHDDIWRYIHQIYESIILLGPYRHYRTVKHTTYTCLASKQLYNKYRQHFQDVVRLTTQRADWVEDKSINLVWNKLDVMLFSPIPGLAFHIMEETGKDPYLDFDSLWDSTPELWK